MTPQIEVYTTKEGFFQLVNAECCQASIYRIEGQQDNDWDIKLVVPVSHIEEYNSEAGLVRVKKHAFITTPE